MCVCVMPDLLPILAQVWHLQFCFLGIPEIAATDFSLLAQAVVLWDLKPHSPVASVSIEKRRASRGARSAYALATYERKPFLEACHCCGTWTASWCEACYKTATVQPDHKYSALCAACDKLKLVCPGCHRNGSSWKEGNKVAQAETGDLGEDAIAITGYGVDGQLIPADCVNIQLLQQMAEDMGCTVAELRTQLFEDFGIE